jgi:hypothetical protein
MASPLLVEAFPDLASELQERLTAASEFALADSIPTLRIHHRCECSDDQCAMLYTIRDTRPAGGPTHREFAFDSVGGMLVVDVEQDRITCIEVLFRPDVRRRLVELVPGRPLATR